MEAKAYLRYVRISPRKVQIVCDLIRGKDINTAMALLMQTPKAASEPLVKLLKERCRQRREQLQHGYLQAVRVRGLRDFRPDPQAHDPRQQGPRLPHQQENLSRDARRR